MQPWFNKGYDPFEGALNWIAETLARVEILKGEIPFSGFL